eukprot:scaffold379061_cov20-Prasinocladus_malaysianus.AAC.1
MDAEYFILPRVGRLCYRKGPQYAAHTSLLGMIKSRELVARAGLCCTRLLRPSRIVPPRERLRSPADPTGLV